MTQTSPYQDPTTGEWVGEHVTRDAEGNVRRDTKWFAAWADAEYFARTGQRPAPDQCSEVTGRGRRCARRGMFVVVKTSARVCRTHAGELAAYGLQIENWEG